MLDESTSAVDTKTEGIIYQHLNELHVWFVTISHRPSLMKYHKKELKLYSKIRASRENSMDINDDDHNDEDQLVVSLPVNRSFTSIHMNEQVAGETQLTSVSNHNTVIGYVDMKPSDTWFTQVRDVWRVIHLPFGTNDRKLRIQVIGFETNSNEFFRRHRLDLFCMDSLFNCFGSLYIYFLSCHRSNRCYIHCHAKLCCRKD